MLCGTSRAASFELVIPSQSPIIVDLLAPMPPSLISSNGIADVAQGAPSTIIHHADAYTVDGGFYTSDDGFAYLPPISSTGLIQLQWSFEVWAGDPAKWRILRQTTYSPDYIVIGTVVDGKDTLANLTASDHAAVFGIADVPVDFAGNPYRVTQYFDYARETLQAAPEPTTLAILAPLVFVKWRKR